MNIIMLGARVQVKALKQLYFVSILEFPLFQPEI